MDVDCVVIWEYKNWEHLLFNPRTEKVNPGKTYNLLLILSFKSTLLPMGWVFELLVNAAIDYVKSTMDVLWVA